MADPYPVGARVRGPLGSEGLIVDTGPTKHIRRYAWIGPFGRPVEALMPVGALTVIALPLPETPKG